jgi:hypothetical protein
MLTTASQKSRLFAERQDQTRQAAKQRPVADREPCCFFSVPSRARRGAQHSVPDGIVEEERGSVGEAAVLVTRVIPLREQQETLHGLVN